MEDELILPEADTPIIPTDAPASGTEPRSHKKNALIILAVVVFVILAASLVFIITNKSTDSRPAETTDDPTSSEPSESFYYNQEEFTDALDHAYSHLDNQNYSGVEFYLKPYSAVERMTAAQRYRFYSIYAEMYSEAHLNEPESAQKYTELANDALKSIREGEN